MEFPGERLLIRLWETITERGIGSLLRPWQIRREGLAQIDVEKQRILAVAETHLATQRLVEQECSQQFLNVIPKQVGTCPAEQSIVGVVLDGITREAMREQINLSKVLLATEDELRGDPSEPPPNRIDDDWLHRWRASASAVGNEDLQKLWARLLANELKSPGTFSLRTLDLLKNLTAAEATNIAKLAPFVIAGNVCKADNAFFERHGIPLAFLLDLQELGILAGVDAIGLQKTYSSNTPDRFEFALICNNRVLVVKQEDPNKKLSLGVCQLTTVGREILRLGTFVANEPYLREVGKMIVGQGFQVILGDYVSLSEKHGKFENGEQL